MERKSAWNGFDEAQLEELEQLTNGYMDFLSNCKTERECAEMAVSMAKEAGYRHISEYDRLKAGDKVYFEKMGKAVALFRIGKLPLEQGMYIIGSHIDSPRLDVKQNPLYEDNDMCYLDTHYYGGIKKYQWTALPLAIHGIVVKKDGAKVKIAIGEAESDPVVYVSDLLVHLSSEQMEKKASKVVEGEALDILIGNRPCPETEKDAVKDNILKLLQARYGIDEDDFLSAELEIVPAGRARSAGLDGSMIAGYGHDDRVCAYPSLRALFNINEDTEHTVCCLLFDKEEIGSMGATGAQSRFFENAVAELLEHSGGFAEIPFRRCFDNSKMLSSDVTAALDPLYASVFEKRISAHLGKGVAFEKFTGSRGKSGSNDASPEFIAYLRGVLDRAGISFQMTEMGKVDAGGGGTIALLFGNYGMEVIDCGVPVISMHAPWELVSKADVYEAYRCYYAFYSDQG